MKIAVISDSHGNYEFLRQLAGKKGIAEGVDLLVHLGDDSVDTEVLNFSRIISVPGVYENSYAMPGTKRRIVEDFDGVKVLMTHTPGKHSNDMPFEGSPEETASKEKVDLVLYGHTHAPKIERKEDGILWVNPGHLKKHDNRGHRASYAVMDTGSGIKDLKISVFDFVTGEELIVYP